MNPGRAISDAVFNRDVAHTAFGVVDYDLWCNVYTRVRDPISREGLAYVPGPSPHTYPLEGETAELRGDE